MSPQFSVIVPVYNVERYLTACVGSVLAQRGDFELILVDDGSTDHSGSICQAFADTVPNVTAIHQPNAGLAGARTTGMKAARGEWLLFLDSDDLWPNGMLDELAVCMAAHPGFDWFVCAYEELRPDGTLAPPPLAKLVPGEFCSDDYAARVSRLRQNYWSVWKYALRRSWVEANALWFEPSIRYAEDMPWDLQALRFCKKLCFLDLVMVQYRTGRPGSLVNAHLERHFEGFLASLRFFEAQKLPAEQREVVLRWLADAFWPDFRAAAKLPAQQRAACLPAIRALAPLYDKGTQYQGRAVWRLYHALLKAFGPAWALRIAHRLHG